MKFLSALLLLSSLSAFAAKDSRLIGPLEMAKATSAITKAIRVKHADTEVNSLMNYGTLGSVNISNISITGESINLALDYLGPADQCEYEASAVYNSSIEGYDVKLKPIDC